MAYAYLNAKDMEILTELKIPEVYWQSYDLLLDGLQAGRNSFDEIRKNYGLSEYKFGTDAYRAIAKNHGYTTLKRTDIFFVHTAETKSIIKVNRYSRTQRVTLDTGEIMTCTINPEHLFPNDAFSCVFTKHPELYVKKNQAFVIENAGRVEVTVPEYDRQQGKNRFSIKKIF